jgi:uncharacterized glyoxalase superfamily protein PhnB
MRSLPCKFSRICSSTALFPPRFGMLADKFGVHWMIATAQ